MRLINRVLLQEIKHNFLQLFLVLLLILLAVSFDVISPWPFKILIDNVLSTNPLSPSWNVFHLDFIQRIMDSRYLLGFVAVFLYFFSTFSLTIVEYMKSIVNKKTIRNLISNFSKNSFKNLESFAIGFYKDQQIGDFIYRLSYDVSAIGDFMEDGIIPLITSTFYLGITLAIMFYIDRGLTLISFAVLPFLAFGLYFFNLNITTATKHSEFLNSAMFSFIEEALTHLKIIQAFSQEKRQAHTFNRRTDISLSSDVNLFRLDFLLTLLVGVIIAISYSVIILYGIKEVFLGTLTSGLLIVFIFYLDNLTNPILSIIYAVTAAKQSYAKIIRMNDFFAQGHHLSNSGLVKKITDPTIKFQHVTLNIKGSKILQNASFEIEPGKKTVIFGVSGSGKSSIVNLILRFVAKPNSGKIFIGGIDIQNYDIKSLRSNIAFVPQEITLFDDTIFNNIAFGNPLATKKDIRKAAEMAGAHEFISRLPDSYNFMVGEGGNLISGGQRQRLMLARAFLRKDAKILLFDETLSALDVKTRKEVIKNIYEFSQNKTTIIVSNVFDVVKLSDNVIVLNRGKVIYSGPNHKLSREVSLYKMILKSQ